MRDRLHLIQAAVTRSLQIDPVDLVIANLVIEYVGVQEFVAFAAANAPAVEVWSCVVQHNDTTGFVSATQDAPSFDVLARHRS